MKAICVKKKMNKYWRESKIQSIQQNWWDSLGADYDSFEHFLMFHHKFAFIKYQQSHLIRKELRNK